MDITQNHCEKQLKNILVCRLIMSYNEQEFKDNSSGRGVIPHRRYSPRPMETWLNRCDSGTDSDSLDGRRRADAPSCVVPLRKAENGFAVLGRPQLAS